MTRPHFQFWPRRLPHNISSPQTSLWYNLEVSARRYPDKDAIIFYGRHTTFRELHDDAVAVAGWLQQVAGVQKGDRVLLYMQNCPQFMAAYYGILRADAVVVPVNPMNRPEEFKHYITDAGAATVICSADLAVNVTTANAELPEAQRTRHLLVTSYADALPARYEYPEDAPPAWITAQHPAQPGAVAWNDALAQRLTPGPHTAGPDDLAVMPYTSGTTGFPKGCMHPHRTVMHNIVGGSMWSNGTKEGVSLSIIPLFHVTGMQYGMNAPIYMGSTVVMLPRWDREVAGRLISRYKITHWTNIPTMVIDFLASPQLAEFDLSSLAYIGGGGAAMPQAVAERLLKDFNLAYQEGYGLSETIAPTHSNPADRAKQQCLGIPVFNTDARIVDPQTLQELPIGEVGEIIVSGPQVFLGYWGKPQASAEVFIEFRRQALLPHRRPWPDGRRRLLLPHRPAETHDQRVGLQGVAGRGGKPAVQASRRTGGLHHRQARRVSRRVGQGGGGTQGPRQGQDHRRRHHQLGARQHGGLQVPARGRVCGCAAQVRHGQGDVAHAAGAGKRKE